jgi:hypothetical protein
MRTMMDGKVIDAAEKRETSQGLVQNSSLHIIGFGT